MAWIDFLEPYIVYCAWNFSSVVCGGVVGLLRLLVVYARFVQFLRVFGGEVIESYMLMLKERLEDILVPDDTQYLEQHCGCNNSND